MTIKKIGIKIKIQNKFCFWLKGEIEKNFNWIKGPKQFKIMRFKIQIKIKIIFWLKGEIEKKNQFNKIPKE